MFEWLYTICKISRKKLYLREKQDAKSRLKRENCFHRKTRQHKQSFSKNLADHQFLSAKIEDTD